MPSSLLGSSEVGCICFDFARTGLSSPATAADTGAASGTGPAGAKLPGLRMSDAESAKIMTITSRPQLDAMFSEGGKAVVYLSATW